MCACMRACVNMLVCGGVLAYNVRVYMYMCEGICVCARACVHVVCVCEKEGVWVGEILFDYV